VSIPDTAADFFYVLDPFVARSTLCYLLAAPR
jgi:hypothetical protein